MIEIKKVGIVIKPHAQDIEKILKDLIVYFKNKAIICMLEKTASEKLGESGGVQRIPLLDQVDLVIVLGGDGTLLSIAHLAAQKKVPVMGVNLGRLGFLTEVPLDEMFLTLDSYLNGETGIISPRRMLLSKTDKEEYYCLNDVVINKGALARMIQCKIWINDKEVAVVRSDGLILSTPTGSTAYSLSAGGPIVQPNIPAILIAPICPHTLSFRPMVISQESRVRIQVLTGDEEVYLTIDGQRGQLLHIGESVNIRCSDHELKLISSPKRNYFDLVQEKLGWG
ncbi:MAG: NAD(+)/NADH kinase [Candidatus Aminicenantes bacterium]|nr:NAD(+)/NADH kinase [Candidatus Aminicenantes bacterium]